MIDASKVKRIVNLFTRGSHHGNLSMIYIVQLIQPLFSVIQELTRQIANLDSGQANVSQANAVKRPFGYLLIDLKTTTQHNCRLRTNVLPSEEGFNQAGFQENIPQELLKYLKQQTLSPVPLLPAMQEIQGNMDDVLSRNDLRDDEKAKRYFQLQNRYLAFKEQLNTRTRPEEIISAVPDLTSSAHLR